MEKDDRGHIVQPHTRAHTSVLCIPVRWVRQLVLGGGQSKEPESKEAI